MSETANEQVENTAPKQFKIEIFGVFFSILYFPSERQRLKFGKHCNMLAVILAKNTLFY